MKKSIRPFSFLVLLLTAFLPFNSMATKHVVNVQNFSFSPANITNVQVGDTIRWVWVSGIHTTTSSVIPAGAASWDSPISSTVTSFEYKVLLAGTYNYVCTPHAAGGMVASFTAVSSPALSVTPANQNVAATAGNTTFTVTSNSNWTATSNQTWCTVTPSGSNNGTIIATYTANLLLTVRVATITVTVAGLPSQTITVTQAGAAPILVIGPSDQIVSADAGSVDFSITSNTSWTAQSNVEWCTVTSGGTGNGTLVADYTENTTYEVRVAELIVTVSGLPSQTVTVTQEASTVSVNTVPLTGFQLFPNPAKAYFKINTKNLTGASAILSVFTMNGNIVLEKSIFTGSETQVDVSRLTSGSYIVSVVCGDQKLNQQLVIIH